MEIPIPFDFLTASRMLLVLMMPLHFSRYGARDRLMEGSLLM
jgi:hypothetical protein